ncbi:MAG: hypothetical protein ABWZ79_06475 [Pedobacter agri]
MSGKIYYPETVEIPIEVKRGNVSNKNHVGNRKMLKVLPKKSPILGYISLSQNTPKLELGQNVLVNLDLNGRNIQNIKGKIIANTENKDVIKAVIVSVDIDEKEIKNLPKVTIGIAKIIVKNITIRQRISNVIMNDSTFKTRS